MKKDLLVCIAFHYNHPSDRIDYILEVIRNYQNNYNSFDIIIDTNSKYIEHTLRIENVKVALHENLQHPFHLTWMHRKHIKDNIDNYDNFMYVEDDMLVPYENYLNYLENFKLLWPRAVPSFVRIEENNGEQFISDVPKQQQLHIHHINGKQFHSFTFPYSYHAFWIMPAKELKETMNNEFVQLSDGREFAASHVAWGLNKMPMVELENGQISKKCYSYHLPNNYATSPGTPNGKIKPENIFK